MAIQDISRVEAFKAEAQRKIDRLLDDFAKGKINREQFNAVYAHHNQKIELAQQAMLMDDPELLETPLKATVDILQAHMGKAVGIMIYHNRTGMFVDTLGTFDIPAARIAPIVNDFTELMECNRFIDGHVERMGDSDWLLFVGGNYTTVITLFQHEPSPLQRREIERLHHDFEVANEPHLSGNRINSSRLAYPFLVFIQQKMRKN